MVYERASIGGDEERRVKFGDYALMVMAWIEGNAYIISAPTLTTDEVTQLVRSLKPIS